MLQWTRRFWAVAMVGAAVLTGCGDGGPSRGACTGKVGPAPMDVEIDGEVSQFQAPTSKG